VEDDIVNPGVGILEIDDGKERSLGGLIKRIYPTREEHFQQMLRGAVALMGLIEAVMARQFQRKRRRETKTRKMKMKMKMKREESE
jgi:hypothetical protein